MTRGYLIGAYAALIGALAMMAGCEQKRGTDLNVALAEREAATARPASDHSAAADQPILASTAPQPQQSGPTPPAGNANADKPAQETSKEDAEKKLKEAEQRKLNMARLERELALAHEKLTAAKLAMRNTQLTNETNLAKVGAELEIARQKFEIFRERSTPTRVGRAELELQGARDGAKEAEEELQQLEMMYKEDELADRTKEIVLERGRRRLERARRDLELRTADVGTLKERTIPVETGEQELGVREKERALAQAQRDAEAAMLEKRIAAMSAEAEIARIEAELENLRKEEQRAQTGGQ